MQQHWNESPNAQTHRLRVWQLLSDFHWHSTSEISAPLVGGSEGTRRLRELRQDVRAGRRAGYKDIEVRKRDSGTQYEYRLVLDPTPRQLTLLPKDDVTS